MPGVEKTMHEFKTGELRSGSGAKVTSREQAIAIALSEEREAKKKKRKATDGEVVMSRWNGRDERDKEFSTELRKELAKSGKAMKGGGFPIENEADLKNAIQAFGRAGNKAAAKAHIKKRAAALGKTELLPENWDSADPLWVGNDALCHSIYDAWMETDDQEAIRKYGRDWNARRKPDDDDDDEDDEERDDDEDDYNDAATHLEMRDAFVVDAVRKTKDGYLVANARIARTGIQLYSGHELGIPDKQVVRVYRPPEEVFDRRAMRSMATLPVTLDHPPMMVDSSNWKQYAVGDTGEDVARDGECIRVPLIIKDAAAIEAYEKHGICELSVGYGCDLRWGRGKTPDGEVYDATQTAIRGNHLAVVPAARGGSRLRIGDDQDRGENDMARILIGDRLVELAENEAQHVQSYIAKLQADAKKKDDDEESGESAEEEQAEEKKTRGERDAALGKVAALTKQLEDERAKSSPAAIHAAAKALSELIVKADAVMEGKVNFDGKDPAEIRRMVVTAKLGDAVTKALATDEAIAGAFQAIIANVKPRNGTDRLADSLNLLGQGGGDHQPSAKQMKDAAYNEYVKHITGAWKQ